MASSLKTRGSDISVLLAVDGKDQQKSLTKVVDFNAKTRADISEDDYLGEDATEHEIQIHGYDVSFTVDMIDEEGMLLWEEIVAREKARTAHPKITLKVIYTFREPGVRPRMTVYPEITMMMEEEGAGGRKEKAKQKWMGKCQRRILMAL